MDKVTLEITNDKLEEAIEIYLKEPSKENLSTILNLLRPTVLLVPAMLKAPNQPVPCFLKNNNGEQYLAAFTSKEQLEKGPKAQAVLKMPFPACNNVVVKEELALTGMIINPFGTSFVLKKELVQKLHEVDEKTKQVKLTPEQFKVLAKKQVEFGILPKRLHTEKEAFMELLSKEREALINKLFADAYKDAKLYPYTEADYSVMVLDIAEDLRLARIDFPEQDIVPPLCYRVYLTLDPITKETHYFTIEKMANGNPRLLGGFDEKGAHMNYGEAPVEGAEMDQIIMLARHFEGPTS